MESAWHTWLGILLLCPGLHAVVPKKLIAQGISNIAKVILICQNTQHKVFWSYLSQFFTVFDDPGSKIKGIMCGSQGV